MSDTVASIFKTLIKVPIIIAICYLLFNIFAFTVSYFRLLGASYTVMQVAMENNYIPTNERNEIQDKYLDKMNGSILQNVKIVENSASTNTPDNKRYQYGHMKEVGVKGDFYWITPFSRLVPGYNRRGTNGRATLGYNGTVGSPHRKGHEIKITYKVPGLKYYPDLDTNDTH